MTDPELAEIVRGVCVAAARAGLEEASTIVREWVCDYDYDLDDLLERIDTRARTLNVDNIRIGAANDR